jgi:hypothetical protein
VAFVSRWPLTALLRRRLSPVWRGIVPVADAAGSNLTKSNLTKRIKNDDDSGAVAGQFHLAEFQIRTD